MALAAAVNTRLMTRATEHPRCFAWEQTKSHFHAAAAGFLCGPICCHFGLLLCCGMHVFVWRFLLEFAIASAVVSVALSLTGDRWGKEGRGMYGWPDWVEMPGFVFLAAVLALGWRFAMPPIVTAVVPGASADQVLITATGRRYHRPECTKVPADRGGFTSRTAARLLGMSGCKECGAASWEGIKPASQY